MPGHENRRRFIAETMGLGAAFVLGSGSINADDAPSPNRARGKNGIACNEYPWRTFYQREGRDFRADLDESISRVAAAGFDGFEPLVDSLDYLERLMPILQRHGLTMHSLYVNSVLHEEESYLRSIEQVLRIADAARAAMETQIIVVNPTPIRWGGDENKTDKQLQVQRHALSRLGQELLERPMTLAYHNHDAELRLAARELHHMLAGTDPKVVKLCLDAHWIYRGAGDSSVALFDIVRLYGSRIVELHLRQSQDGVWTEAFGPGDIDYAALNKKIDELGLTPHVVLEQAVEAESPKSMSALAAHKQGLPEVKRIFG